MDISKNKFFKLIIVLLVSISVPLGIEKFYFNNQAFMIERFFIYFMVCLFIGVHFVCNIKWLWNQVYLKRYLIGVLIFIYMVVNCYHGSSIGLYNNAIQGNYPIENGYPIIGENRVIRGDEWAVTSMLLLSQSNEKNDFGTVNHTLMDMDKPVNLYLKLPTKDLSILGNPAMLFFLVLPVEQAFSANWNLSIFVLFFATFELLMIITKKNKICSAVGAVAVVFSPAIQWWESYNMLAYGEVAVIAFYNLLKTNKIWFKILLSILIGFAGSVYIMTMYPAWMVPYGYFFLAIIIWMLYDQRGEYSWKDFVIMVPIVIIVITAIILPAYLDSKEIFMLTSQTVYPGLRLSTGGYGWDYMFKFFSSIFTPFSESSNPSEMSQFICLYPLPMFIGGYHIIKNKQNKKFDFLLILLVALSIFLGIWNFVELPEIVAKITMLSMSTIERCNIVLGFINVIIMLICMFNYSSDEKINYKKVIIVALISIAYVVLGVMININFYGEYLGIKKLLVMIIVFLVLGSLFLYNNKRTNKILILLIVLLNFGTGIFVHPLNKGLSVVFDKPVSKEIQEIVSRDSDATWITVSTPYYLQNYVAANGASIINSTNYFPNFDLWDKIDSDREYEEIYNRYAHITVELTRKKSTVELLYGDHIIMNLNISQLEDLNVKYILSSTDLSNFNSNNVRFEQIYIEDGIMIYKVSYN